MAEQDVRPQQLSIRDIARLWCAETGESASELEDELSNWAYAEAVDRGAPGSGTSDPEATRGAAAALKIEPDPTRELSWNDLEAFCKDHDRLIPRFWPEPPRETSDSSRPVAPSEPRRLVIRAMTKLGPLSGNAAAERRLQGPVPVRGEQRPKPTQAAGGPNGAEAGEDRPAETNAAESAGTTPAKAAKRRPELVTVWPAPAPESLRETAILAPAPASADYAARREAKPRRPVFAGGVALGAAFGLALAVAAGALWLEYKGPGLIAVIGQDAGKDAAVAAAEERLAEASALARDSEQRATRLEGQLAEARREVDTLRAETRDVAALSQQLEEAQARSAELSATLESMRAEGNDSQRAFLDQLGAARQDATRLAAAAQASQAEAERLTQELTAARKAVEPVEAARDQALKDRLAIADRLAAAQQQVADLTNATAAADAEAQRRIADLTDAQAVAVARARRLDGDLATARDEIENLAQTGAAAQAVIQRQSEDLQAARTNLDAVTTAKQDAEGKAAALGRDLAAARAQLGNTQAASAAAEGEVRRLAGELDNARLEASELRAAAEGSTGEAKKLLDQMQAARREAIAASAAKTDAEAAAADLSAKLAKSQESLAAAQQANAEAARLKPALAEATKAVAKVEERLTASEARAKAVSADLSAKLAESQEDVVAARAAAQQANAEAARLKPELAEAAKAVAKVEERLTASEARAKAAAADLIQVRRQADDLRTAATRAESEKRSGLSAAGSWKTKADELASALEQATQRVVRLTAQNAALTPAGGAEKAALIGTAPAAPEDFGKVTLPTNAALAGPAPTQGPAAADAPELPAAAPPAANPPAAMAAVAARSSASPSLLARGDEYLGRGDIASARLFYEQAAEQGDAAAFTAIGKTYDPAILRRLGILGAFASPKQALAWYKRGVDAGDAEAARRLAELQPKLNQ